MVSNNSSENSKNFLSIKKPTFFGMLASAAILCFVMTVFSFLDPIWWFFGLSSHFKMQYGLFLIFFLPFLLFKKKYLYLGPVIILIVINLYPVLSLFLPNEKKTLPESANQEFTAMLLNVEARNDKYQQAVDVIKEINPDVLILEEFTDDWLNGTGELKKIFPYSFGAPEPDCSGNMLFSKYPLDNPKIEPSGPYARPTIVVTANIKGKKVNIVGTHPMPPIGEERSRMRDQHLLEVADILADLKGKTVFMGDINSTPYSDIFKRVLKKSGLENSMQGFGPQLSWPAWKGYLSPFLIPIDHCFTSKDVLVLDRTIGPYAGSDHYPLILKLGI